MQNSAQQRPKDSELISTQELYAEPTFIDGPNYIHLEAFVADPLAIATDDVGH